MAESRAPRIPYVSWFHATLNLTPKQTLYLALPLVALIVLVLAYFRLFSSPVVIAILVVLYVAVSLRNRRKFAKREEGKRSG